MRTLAAALMVFCSVNLLGCVAGGMPWDKPEQAQEPQIKSTWLEEPYGYAAMIKRADRSRRARMREEAVMAFARNPVADLALRVQLVFSASVVDLDDAHQASDQIDNALEANYSQYVTAVVTGLKVQNDQRLASMREAVTLASEMAVLKGNNQELADLHQKALANGRRASDSLRKAEDKIRRLMSIETGGSDGAAANEIETSGR